MRWYWKIAIVIVAIFLVLLIIGMLSPSNVQYSVNVVQGIGVNGAGG
jgi:hypothetical protein